MSDHRLLVTGATGTLGSAARRLVDSEAVVWSSRDGAGGTVAAELEDPAATRTLVEQAAPDVVLHLAATGVVGGRDDLAGLVAANLTPLATVLDAVRDTDRTAVVVASSDLAVEARDNYGLVKRLAETVVTGTGGRPVLAVRLPVLLGPTASPRSFVGSALAAAAAGQELELREPERVRRWLHVDDAVRALFHACRAVAPGGGAGGFIDRRVVTAPAWRASVAAVRDGLAAAAGTGGATPAAELDVPEPGLPGGGWRPTLDLDGALRATLAAHERTGSA